MKQDISRRGLLLGAGMAALSSPALAQVPGLGGLGGIIGDNLPKVANGLSLTSLAGNRDLITTSLKDAKYGVPSMDNFVPPVPKKSLKVLQRNSVGAFVLTAGYFDFHAQSYCFHAGTHGPGGGNAYLYAPTLGSAAALITQIRQNSFLNPDIEQHDIQSLIWAILSRAKFETLSPELQAVAARLMTKQQLLTLNRSALDVIPPSVLNKTILQAPPALQQALRAEGQIRSLLSSGGSYASIERVAVLTGDAPWGAGSIETPQTRWSLHPDGYYIRFTPSGYSHTYVEVWVEKTSKAIGKILDLCTHVAVPCNTSRQRLGQSNREKKA